MNAQEVAVRLLRQLVPVLFLVTRADSAGQDRVGGCPRQLFVRHDGARAHASHALHLRRFGLVGNCWQLGPLGPMIHPSIHHPFPLLSLKFPIPSQ
ncbi:hypothetical protein C8F04DRAFT_1066350 [Mycena alexandri]|uniref:Secreted protein n=1 Tax=Mycena alexandri TaxID=1745969 RepID=A0AAD6TL48_9AGAR|nr:hypothetical protein C8F04DRAFT_1066350 [Mycena alexandri]